MVKVTEVRDANLVIAEVEGESDETEILGRSCMERRKFVIIQEIENFSLRIDHGDYVSPRYYDKRTGCIWNLIVSRHSDGQIRIELEHNQCKGKHLSVMAYVTIGDSFGWRKSLYAYKKLHFQGLFPYEILLQVPEKELMYGYWGLNRKRFLPKDKLTVKCEITTYKNCDTFYVNEEALDKKVENSKIYVAKVIFTWLAVLLVHVFLAVAFFCCYAYVNIYYASPLVERFLVTPLTESTLANILYENIPVKLIRGKPLLESVFTSTYVDSVLSTPVIQSVLLLLSSNGMRSYLLSAGISFLFTYILLNLLRKSFAKFLHKLKRGGDKTYLPMREA